MFGIISTASWKHIVLLMSQLVSVETANHNHLRSFQLFLMLIALFLSMKLENSCKTYFVHHRTSTLFVLPNGCWRLESVVHRSVELLHHPLHAGGCQRRAAGKVPSIICPSLQYWAAKAKKQRIICLFCRCMGVRQHGRTQRSGWWRASLGWQVHSNTSGIPCCDFGQRT